MKNYLFLMLTACFFLVSGCISVEPPQIKYIDTSFKSISSTEIKLASEFSAKNNNPVGLQGTVEYELYINNKKISSGTTSTIDLLPKQETSFTLESKVDLADVFGALSDLIGDITAGKTSVPFTLKGKFKTAILNVPVEAPLSASGNIPLPKLSDLIKL